MTSFIGENLTLLTTLAAGLFGVITTIITINWNRSSKKIDNNTSFIEMLRAERNELDKKIESLEAGRNALFREIEAQRIQLREVQDKLIKTERDNETLKYMMENQGHEIKTLSVENGRLIEVNRQLETRVKAQDEKILKVVQLVGLMVKGGSDRFDETIIPLVTEINRQI